MLNNLWRTQPAQSSSSSSIALGARAEDTACEYLQNQGLKLKDRNYRTRRGEIDLVMQSKDTIIFVEVRYRSSNQYGSPGDSITLAKRQKIIAAAQEYLISQGYGSDTPTRVDAILITPPPAGHLSCTINWIKNILT